VGVLAAAVVAALAWLLYTGFKARTELEAVRSDVHALRSHVAAGDLDAARADARSLRHHADRAHELTTGPVWAGAAAVPFLGEPVDTTRAVTAGVGTIADHALTTLVDATRQLDPSGLRGQDGSFDVAAIARVAPSLHRAGEVMSTALDTIRAASGSTWLHSVNAARSELLDQLGQLTGSVRSAQLAATVLPPMLGNDGPRSYMVAFENEAELRGTGGLPGAFAILRADHGRLSFTRFEPDNALNGVASDVRFGPDYDALWTGGPTAVYVDSNMSPHFPYAARIWAAMWQRKTGQRLDGAIALDPTTLAYLLAVTGPAELADGGTVSASNIVALTQRDVYQRFARDNDARKKYLLDIARAVSTKLVGSGADPTSLVKAAARAASESRLLVWTRHADVEKLIEPLPISGSVPERTGPYAGLTLINNAGTKLDYYLHAAMTWKRTRCDGLRDVTVTIRLVSDAPDHGLPPYVLGFTGRPGFPQQPGTNRLSLFYFASAGAELVSATRNGQPQPAGSGSERGHPVIVFGMDLAPRRPQLIVLHLREPAGSGPPVTRVQPLVHPMDVTVRDAQCGS
jgi:hypothetical protein